MNQPGLKLLGLGEFQPGGGARLESIRTYGGEFKNRHVVHPGDLLVALTDVTQTGDVLGSPLMVPWSVGQECLFTHHIGRVDVKVPDVDRRFLYYLLQAPFFSAFARGYATGTTVRALSPSDVSYFEFSLPSLPEQRAIVQVLSTMDDKIELNRHMNETLGAMAWALFKSWFVDFDPVRDKMDDRWRRRKSLLGLPTEHYDLFPGRLVDSKIGEIPMGWEVGVLDDSIVLLSGGTPKTSESDYWGGDIPWYTAKDAPDGSDIFAMNTERTITNLGVENCATQVLDTTTTVITARGTVGRLACLGLPMAMNQTCYGIRGAHGYPNYFTYWNIRTAVDELQSRTHGTIFDTITRQTFKLVEIALPPPEVAQAFEGIIKPVMVHILNNLKESHALVVQRDTLLPKLVSGEVRI